MGRGAGGERVQCLNRRTVEVWRLLETADQRMHGALPCIGQMPHLRKDALDIGKEYRGFWPHDQHARKRLGFGVRGDST